MALTLEEKIAALEAQEAEKVAALLAKAELKAATNPERAAELRAKADALAVKTDEKIAKITDKYEAKQVKIDEKNSIAQLRAAQNAEIYALQQAGASREEIKAEKAANKVELAGAKDFVRQIGNQSSQVGIQQVLPNGQPYITSKSDTYSGDRANFVSGILNSAASNYANYGVASLSRSGNTTTGLGLDKLVRYEAGDAGRSVTKLMDQAKTYVGQTFSPEELAAAGVKLKEVKGADGLYQWKTGGGETQNYTFFAKDPNTGQFVGTGVNRTYTPGPSGIAGFMQSDLGQAAMIAASIWGAPALGSLLTTAGTSAAIQAAAGAAAINAAATAASGGGINDVLRNAATGAASAYTGNVAGSYVPTGYNPAVASAVQGAASGATQAALSGGDLNDITKAALTGATVGGVGSGIQQLVSPTTPVTSTGEIQGTTGFAAAADEVGGAGAGGPSGVEVSPVAPWDQTVTQIAPTATTTPTLSADAEAQPGGFYGATDTSYTTPQGVVVTDRSVPYDPNYVEPGVWDSIKNLGGAVYDFAVQNPSYAAMITAGLLTIDDLVRDALSPQAPKAAATTTTPPVIPPFNTNVGPFGVSGGFGATGGYGGNYGNVTFAPGYTAGAVPTPLTYADLPLLAGQAPGSPIMAEPGIMGLAPPAPTNLSLPLIVRPPVNVSQEGQMAADIASLLDSQAAGRYNAAPAVLSGDVARFGETATMKEGGLAGLAQYGRHGDTMLAHISPDEAAMLKSMGGAGTINPVTGLPEYWNPLRELRKGFRKIGDVVEDVARPVARYLPYVAPFIPGLNVAQAAMLSGVAGGLGGDKGFDLKRGVMSGLMTYGIGSLAEGLNLAGQDVSSAAGPVQPEPMSLSNVAQGASNVMTGAPGAREALATKFGTGTGMAAIMGGTGVAAIDEQNAFLAKQQKQLAETEEDRRRNREMAMGLIGQYPIRFAAEGGVMDMVTDEPGYDFAAGGALPPRFLSGGGDGMSDSIPATIEGRQEARLADGEFVIPADVVSGIGNGSSKAGAKQLYAMMDRVRKARTGTTRQGKEINPMRFMPA